MSSLCSAVSADTGKTTAHNSFSLSPSGMMTPNNIRKVFQISVSCYHPLPLIHTKAAILVCVSCMTVRSFGGAVEQLFLCQTHPCLHTGPCIGGRLWHTAFFQQMAQESRFLVALCTYMKEPHFIFMSINLTDDEQLKRSKVWFNADLQMQEQWQSRSNK